MSPLELLIPMDTLNLDESPNHHGSGSLDKLPLEIRLMIYVALFKAHELTLVRTTATKTSDNEATEEQRFRVQEGSQPIGNLLSILQVCDQVRKEAVPIFQSSIPLHIDATDIDALRTYDTGILGGIKRLQVMDLVNPAIPTLQRLFPRVQHLTIQRVAPRSCEAWKGRPAPPALDEVVKHPRIRELTCLYIRYFQRLIREVQKAASHYWPDLKTFTLRRTMELPHQPSPISGLSASQLVRSSTK